MSKEPNHLLWIDLESTGLDPSLDEIIEVGAIATTPDLVVLGEFTIPVTPSSEALDRLLSNEFVANMHRDNGLLDAIEPGAEPRPAADATVAENALLDWLSGIGLGDEKFFLAGSGVSHFDDDMIERHMPRLNARLHYAPLDIGIARRLYRLSVGENLVEVNNSKTHRAIDDVRCHLAEGRAFADVFRAMGKVIQTFTSGILGRPRGM